MYLDQHVINSLTIFYHGSVICYGFSYTLA